MNKTAKYTALTLFLAVVFSLGSMAGMDYILLTRERQLLTESGRAVVETPVRAWQEPDRNGEMENSESSDKERYALTTEQMEGVLAYWKEHTGITVHNPVTGQISMDEVVKTGKEWLANMELLENAQVKDAESVSVSATLGIAGQEVSHGVQLEPYYSFWVMRFESKTMNAVLYLNAVTGEVYQADMTLYEGFPEKMPYEKLERFVELSGLRTSDADMVRNQEGTQAILKIDDSRMYAEMAFRHSGAGYLDTASKENVIINLKIVVEKDR